MGFRLEKDKTGSTPYILVDEEKGYMHFQGESFHENVLAFYSEILDWLQGYLKTDFKDFTFDCELKYFNSSTAKLLYNILMVMDDAATQANHITVNWICSADNEIIIECGEDFSEDLNNLEFNMVMQ